MLRHSEQVRSIMHRIAGVVLIGVVFITCSTSLSAREGRQLIMDLLPDSKDAIRCADALRYYLGLS